MAFEVSIGNGTFVFTAVSLIGIVVAVLEGEMRNGQVVRERNLKV